MDIEIKSVSFDTISPYFVDFQKKSQCFEMPTEEAEFFGIFNNTKMIGYFILCKLDTILEIQQGYLIKEARHIGLEYKAMDKLIEMAKQHGYTKIILQTQRSMKAYNKFMKRLGFDTERIVFGKELN